ncbi:MAG: hypothetical protein LUF32_00995 [Clostridiales bacterium]|nr:hypothetical protein [Clostridiales bacterium]
MVFAIAGRDAKEYLISFEIISIVIFGIIFLPLLVVWLAPCRAGFTPAKKNRSKKRNNHSERIYGLAAPAE